MQGAVIIELGLVLGLAASSYGIQVQTTTTTTRRPDYDNSYPDADIEQYECPKTKISGVYKLTPNDTALDRIEVYCDHKLAGGDWIVLHRRDSGALNFTRNWNDYKHGFGDLEGDHWLGLEEMHLLTRRGQYELGVVLTSSTNELWYAFYDWFAVGPERENYTLHLGDYTGGTVHDSLTFHEGKDFSTSDHDSSSGCPNMHASGWWFGHCYEANLNGLYKPGKRIDSMRWNKLSDLGLLGASMMVRKYDAIRGQHEFPY